MTDPKAPEALRLLFARPEPAPTISEYQREQNALHANRKKLKAERLARESTLITSSI
jgi:hypothetical protein